jgi:hypothetical protein
MALKEILEAAAEDIVTAMGGYNSFGEGWTLCDADSLNAKVFARVFYISQRAEAIACAEDRGDEVVVQTQAMRELEGKAPKMVAALKETLTGGNHLVKEKLRQLEADHKKLREAARDLKGFEQELQQRNLALSSGDERRAGLALRSDNDVYDGELEPLPAPKLDLPRDPELDADKEVDEENAHRKLDISDPKNGYRVG